LQLDNNDLRRLSPQQVDRLHQQAVARMLTTKRLTFEQWDTLVAEWNEDLSVDERKKRYSVCLTKGHDWAFAPINCKVCRRCCAYMEEG